MGDALGIGIIGCGNIAKTYFELAPLFAGFEMRACADLDKATARNRARAYGVDALDVADLLANRAIDLALNLTAPDAHVAVSMAALDAGKHVYSEKPVALSVEDGLALRARADEKGLMVGAAPDTFLGGAHQWARHLIDAGQVGTVTAGTAHVMSHGMEHWHPNPGFFFKPGAGPVLDIGPYYIANLINLIGPVRRVAALANSAEPVRTITSEPRRGETIAVETPTNIHALIEFESGATVTVGASWDVWAHRHGPMELYGTEGSLFLPDPNFFGGMVELAGRDGAIAAPTPFDHPFALANQDRGGRALANYRGAGLADMAQAISAGREARCSLDRALHALEVMTGILASAADGVFVDMRTRCTRPAPLGPEDARTLMAD